MNEKCKDYFIEKIVDISFFATQIPLDIKGISSTSIKASVQMYLPLSLKISALSNISALVLLDFCGEDTYFSWAGLGSARLSLARLGSARLGSARLDSTRLGSAQLGSARLSSA